MGEFYMLWDDEDVHLPDARPIAEVFLLAYDEGQPTSAVRIDFVHNPEARREFFLADYATPGHLYDSMRQWVADVSKHDGLPWGQVEHLPRSVMLALEDEGLMGPG